MVLKWQTWVLIGSTGQKVYVGATQSLDMATQGVHRLGH